MANKIQLRRDTAANWTTANPVLGQGEPGAEIDTGRLKIGDGVKTWTALPDISDSHLQFTQEGTGAKPRSIESKLRDTVSVKDFGDVDGVGEIVVTVPGDYATINAAVAAIQAKTLTAGTTYRINVQDGTYTLTAPITIDHPNGRQIKLVGNEVTPSNCVITVAGVSTFDALVVAAGAELGYINGFRFNLAAKAVAANNYTAILAVDGGRIGCGPDIEVNNWYYGIAARKNSFIYCDGATVSNSGDVGIWAYIGSTIYCRNSSSTGASDVPNNLGFGFQAEYGSAMDCSGSTASGCQIGGIASLSGSAVRAHGCTSSTNVGSGFFARDNAFIENHTSTASSNTGYGVSQFSGGVVSGTGTTLTGNTLGPTNQPAELNVDPAAGARLSSKSGGLRLDTTDAGSIYFNTGGGLQFSVDHFAAVTSHVSAYGSPSDQPGLKAAGPAADVSLNLQAKGAGRIYFGSEKPNFLNAYGSASGQPGLKAAGSAADVSLNLNAKGAGQIYFGSEQSSYLGAYGSASGQPGLKATGSAADVNLNLNAKGVGSIYVGSDRDNFFDFCPTNAGQPPEIRATGGEANIDLSLKPKGSGQLRWGVHSAGTSTANGYVEWKLADGATVRVAAQRI